ncbi:MAG: alpha-1,4-glucan--maltose-1-phosphate maltosyltransferase [Verrucomicrobiae bacterium]|nr:alpha-1,4-glucan--maltose-1-phosphate maltosyltransferase [Verrucomicrobiae bacterium]
MNSPFPTVIIENVQPEIDHGRHPIKRETGDTVRVSADVFKDGHDILMVFLLFRKKGSQKWNRARMTLVNNDLWKGEFQVGENTRYEYTVEACPCVFRSWQHEIRKKHQAGQDLKSELLEGRNLIRAAAQRATAKAVRDALEKLAKKLGAAPNQAAAVELAVSPESTDRMDCAPDRSLATQYERILEVVVDRTCARFAAWYEMFPRSQGKTAGKSGTFKDCEEHLPAIKAMGFDVIYFPPIHPIGKTHRKGPNNTLVAGPNDPGSCYAIGSGEGGHKAVEPSLGTLRDFDRLVKKCRELDMEIALDFAINCSPDHPYVREHPEWFNHRPDGTIKYAENPPKKYQDIYPLNFHCENYMDLWKEMQSIIEFWISHGVKIFRVDNPHTKPVAFWEWLIGNIQKKNPEVLFLAEAFTRPKMMRALAKAGFTQSYTYFTWRNSKPELTEYLIELTQGPMKEYFRGNFFANTPDILHAFLQEGGRPAFKIRATLASTLSPVYGIYSGFELCENKAIPGTEEYLHSEKYEIKVRDWNCAGHIKDYITRLNHIRRENPALQEYDNLRFYRADHDNILFYGKAAPDKSNLILVAVSLNPYQITDGFVWAPIGEYGIRDDEAYQAHDLLTGHRYLWRGSRNYVRFDPRNEIAHIFRICRWRKRENDFDYYDM